MKEAACRPLALITATVLPGVVIGRLAGRNVKELFLEVSGDASEYDDLECLCLLSSRLALFGALISLGASLTGRSVKVSPGISEGGRPANRLRGGRARCKQWYRYSGSISDIFSSLLRCFVWMFQKSRALRGRAMQAGLGKCPVQSHWKELGRREMVQHSTQPISNQRLSALMDLERWQRLVPRVTRGRAARGARRSFLVQHRAHMDLYLLVGRPIAGRFVSRRDRGER